MNFNNIGDGSANYRNWVYAGVGATAETIVRQPLMAVSSVTIDKGCGSFEAARVLFNQGGIAKFYSGIGGLAMGLSQRALHRASTFAINEEMHKRGYPLVSIATIAAACEVCFTMVGENFLTTAQTDRESRTILDILKERYRLLGMRTFSTGLYASMGRNISFNMFYFGPGHFFPDEARQYPLTSSALAGTGAVVASHIFEVLRVRKSVNPQQSYLMLIQDIQRELGARAFVVGVVPRVSSVGVGAIIAMSVYQKLKHT